MGGAWSKIKLKKVIGRKAQIKTFAEQQGEGLSVVVDPFLTSSAIKGYPPETRISRMAGLDSR